MRNQETITRKNQSGYYVEGNVVRKVEAMPVSAPHSVEREESRIQNRRQQKAEAQIQLGWAYVVVVALSVALALAACIGYLYLKAEVASTTKSISSLESQIQELTVENNDALARLEASVDLTAIRTQALELGMNYPTEEQIIYYSVDNSDFMNQYQNIPTE